MNRAAAAKAENVSTDNRILNCQFATAEKSEYAEPDSALFLGSKTESAFKKPTSSDSKYGNINIKGLNFQTSNSHQAFMTESMNFLGFGAKPTLKQSPSVSSPNLTPVSSVLSKKPVAEPSRN
jgi:hypothetical protein